MHTLQAEGPKIARVTKRRMRQYYVKVHNQTFAVWAHSRASAESTAMDHLDAL